MGIESPVHLLFIAVVALIVLGPKRLPGLARALGQGLREFRSSLEDGANPPEPSHAPEPSPPHAAEAGAHQAVGGAQRIGVDGAHQSGAASGGEPPAPPASS